MKKALQGLIMEVWDNEFALKDEVDVLEVSKASSRMITYLYMQILKE